MDYQEAINYSLTVKWKTTPCSSGEKCWCRIIEPEKEIRDKDDNSIYICNSGCVPTEYAEHIVKIHNAFVDKNHSNKSE